MDNVGSGLHTAPDDMSLDSLPPPSEGSPLRDTPSSSPTGQKPTTGGPWGRGAILPSVHQLTFCCLDLSVTPFALVQQQQGQQQGAAAAGVAGVAGGSSATHYPLPLSLALPGLREISLHRQFQLTDESLNRVNGELLHAKMQKSKH